MKTALRQISRWLYALSAAAFLIGVLIQVFFAGMAAVARISSWSNHIGLGHTLGGPVVLMLLLMFPAKWSARIKWLTFLLFVVYALQAEVVIFMRETAPYLAAVHPVLALFDFLIGQQLVRLSFQQLRGRAEELDETQVTEPAGRQMMGEA